MAQTSQLGAKLGFPLGGNASPTPPPPTTVVERRTLSAEGTRAGNRQEHK